MTRIFALLSVFCLVLVAGCADLTHQDWMEKCKYVEESRVRVECGYAVSRIDAALRDRENQKFFGGQYTREAPEDGQCGRFILQKSFTSSVDAIVVLYPEPEGSTIVAVYQEVSGRWSRDLAFKIFDWAAGEEGERP